MSASQKISTEDAGLNEKAGRAASGTSSTGTRSRASVQGSGAASAAQLLDCGYCGHRAMMVVPLIEQSGAHVGKTVLCTQCEAHRTLRSHMPQKAPDRNGSRALARDG
jgi:hypothetical protein